MQLKVLEGVNDCYGVRLVGEDALPWVRVRILVRLGN